LVQEKKFREIDPLTFDDLLKYFQKKEIIYLTVFQLDKKDNFHL
jgi:hypothetical protein